MAVAIRCPAQLNNRGIVNVGGVVVESTLRILNAVGPVRVLSLGLVGEVASGRRARSGFASATRPSPLWSPRLPSGDTTCTLLDRLAPPGAPGVARTVHVLRHTSKVELLLSLTHFVFLTLLWYYIQCEYI